jgi:hypothetical protein
MSQRRPGGGNESNAGHETSSGPGGGNESTAVVTEHVRLSRCTAALDPIASIGLARSRQGAATSGRSLASGFGSDTCQPAT